MPAKDLSKTLTKVADAAINALERRDDHVAPGAKNKMEAMAAKLMSDESNARAHAKQTRRKTSD